MGADGDGAALSLQTQLRVGYHWRELPQVSFLSRQNFCRLLSRQTRVCRRDSNPRPFHHQSGALTTELSPLPEGVRGLLE